MKKFQKSKINLNRILEWGSYLLLFLLPLQTRYFLKIVKIGGEYWEYGSFSIYLSDILIAFLLLLFVIKFFKEKVDFKKLKIRKIWYLFALLEFFVFISIFAADLKTVAFYFYIKILLGFSLFLLLTELKLENKKIVFSILSGVLVQSFIALWQFFLNFSKANKYLGMAEHNPSDLGVFVIELEDKTRLLRSYGGLDHPNILGVYCFFGLFILVKYYLGKRHSDALRKSDWGVFISAALMFLGMLLSFSKAAYIIFFIFSFFLFFWMFFDKLRRVRVAQILLLFSIVFMVFSFTNSERFSERMNVGSRLESRSNSERVLQISEAIQMSKKELLFGVGGGNYTDYLARQDYYRGKSWEYQPVHNVFLLVLNEIGLFGMLVFSSIFFFYLYRLMKAKIYFDFIFLILIMITFMFDHWFWSLHFGILFLFLIFALLERRLKD